MDRAPRVIVCDSHRDQPPPAGPEDAGATPGGGPGGERLRASAAPARVDLHQLPAGAEHFLGRGPELAALDAAWSPGSGIAVVELIAPGGTGKTALVKRWLDGVKVRGWGGALQVYGWSFYSQGTGDDRQASEDHFLASAIERLGVVIAPAANPADKGQGRRSRFRPLGLAGCVVRPSWPDTVRAGSPDYARRWPGRVARRRYRHPAP